MANVFNANPMVLDTTWTAGTIPAALTALSANPQAFMRIVWTGATAGDTLVITDASAAANVLFSEACPVTNQPVTLWQNSEGKKYTFKQSLWVLLTKPTGKLLLYK